jgi:anti-sigma factor RsiW
MGSVTWRDFVEFLDGYLAKELAEEQRAAFNEHLAACPSCVSYMKSYAQAVEIGRRALQEVCDGVHVLEEK